MYLRTLLADGSYGQHTVAFNHRYKACLWYRNDYQRPFYYIGPVAPAHIEELVHQDDTQKFRSTTIEYYDSHFHLDRLRNQLVDKGHFYNSGTTINGLMTSFPNAFGPGFRGGLAIYCDPADYCQIQYDCAEPFIWKMAIGLHPKKAHYFKNSTNTSPGTLQRVLDIITNYEKVQYIGEVGLDYSTTARTAGIAEKAKSKQKMVLSRFAELSTAHKMPLILHIRESGRDKTEAFADCLKTLKASGVPKNHYIIIHHFMMDTWYEAWLREYPNTIFALNSGTIIDTKCARDVLQRLFDIKKLIIESDAPYGAPPQASDGQILPLEVNMPGCAAYAAVHVSSLLDRPYAEVLEQCQKTLVDFHSAVTSIEAEP